MSHSPFSHTPFNFSGLGASASVKGNVQKVGPYYYVTHSGNSLKARTAPGADSADINKENLDSPQQHSSVNPFIAQLHPRAERGQNNSLFHPINHTHREGLKEEEDFEIKPHLIYGQRDSSSIPEGGHQRDMHPEPMYSLEEYEHHMF